jgi:autotransporter-associated beta strand protein
MCIRSMWVRKTTSLLIFALSLPLAWTASAQDASWKTAPNNSFFDSNNNWAPAGIPTGVATFGASTQTNLGLTSDETLGGFTFIAGAPAYSFAFDHRTITLTGAGIVNNSSFQPLFDFTGGSMRFFNASTAGNARIGADFLFFGGTSNAGTADITLLNTVLGGGATFDNASSAANSTITNNASLLFKANASAGQATITTTAGSLTNFKNSSTAANSTIIANDLVLFSDTSSAGNATIVANAGADVLFLDSSTGANARLIINTGATAGFYNHAGTAGSIEGAGIFDLSYFSLTVGSNNLSTEVSGQIIDGGDPLFQGSLTKVGTGTLTLSGVNTYGGATVVDGGTLVVNGSIVASNGVTVNAGGTLGGNGIVGNTTINGGTLAPGNSIGLLTVQGSLVFTAAASYMVEVSPANADRVNVTGAATLGGATVNASFAAGAYIARQYTILNATGGVGGTFGSVVNTNLPSGFTSSLSYDANNVFLNLALNFSTPTGLNGNQQNVANTLTNFFNATGGIPAVFGSLSPGGLTQVSGELATGSQQTTFDAMGLFMGVMTDPLAAGRDYSPSNATSFASESDRSSGKPRSGSERDAYAAIYGKAAVDTFARRWSVWAAGYGGSQTTDGNAVMGSNTATSRIYGTAVGADYRFSPYTLAGFALAGGGTNFSIANGLGSERSDLFQAGAYLRHNVGAAYLTAALAYGWQDITTDRTVTIAGVDRLRAQFNANAWSGRGEGGYRFVMQGVGLTPYAAGQFTTFELPNYAEAVVSGANTFALAYASKSVTASRSELGLRTDKSFAVPDGILTLRGRAAWAHDFNTDRNIAATFQTLPGASFVVNGAAQAHDAALTTASAEMKWLNGFSLAATFEGEFSDVTKSYAGKGVARYAW